MSKSLEYRVVNVDAPGLKFNPFKVFGEDEGAARHFLEHGAFSCSDMGIAHRLERRPVGAGRDDWEAVETLSADRVREIHEEDRKRRQEEAARAARASREGTFRRG